MMPYSICGADISNWDTPEFFTIAEQVGRRDPYPYYAYWEDFDDVIDISGDTVVWEANGDIYGADISNLENIIVFPICLHSGRQYDPAISGNIVVWTDERNDTGDLYGADISELHNIREFVAIKKSGTQEQPAIDGKIIAYTENRFSGEIKICYVFRNHGVLDITFPEPLGSGVGPAISGNRIVWQSNDYWSGRASGATVQIGFAVADGPVENVTKGREFNSIQQAVVDADQGDVIVVEPRTYQENIKFEGKNIVLRSTDPDNPAVVAGTVIDSDNFGSPVTFAGTENETCELLGFTLTGGNSDRGGGIKGNGTLATIAKCVISGNTAGSGGGIADYNGKIENCVIAHNSAGGNGGGLVACDGPIRNCLIYDNSASQGGALNNCDGPITNCTFALNTASAGGGIRACDGLIENGIFWANNPDQIIACSQPSHCCISDWTEGGTGNICADPLFVDVNNENYHLLPDSPGIDAGNPASDYSHEPMPNGACVNMGAYGNTAEATTSRDGLLFAGFTLISKTRVGRTLFQYDLSLSLSNITGSDMTNVHVKLIDASSQVTDVIDDEILFPMIGAGSTADSHDFADYFSLEVDRSDLITPGRLTWQVDYNAGEETDMQIMSAELPIDPMDETDSIGDLTGDNKVNMQDFAKLSLYWLENEPSVNLSGDDLIDIEDLLVLAAHWLEGVLP